jgi:GNAT superfamily N-acetyltransferase
VAPTSTAAISFAPDYALSHADRSRVRALLDHCFPEFFASREYFKQVPGARFLVHREGALVAQMGVEYRAIRVGEQILRVFGVVDLCVHPCSRGAGIASRLLERLEDLGCEHGVDALILFADDARLYMRHGYRLIDAEFRWLAIDDLRSHSVLQRPLTNVFMAKRLDSAPWPPGVIDLLGYLF